MLLLSSRSTRSLLLEGLSDERVLQYLRLGGSTKPRLQLASPWQSGFCYPLWLCLNKTTVCLLLHLLAYLHLPKCFSSCSFLSLWWWFHMHMSLFCTVLFPSSCWRGWHILLYDRCVIWSMSSIHLGDLVICAGVLIAHKYHKPHLLIRCSTPDLFVSFCLHCFCFAIEVLLAIMLLVCIIIAYSAKIWQNIKIKNESRINFDGKSNANIRLVSLLHPAGVKGDIFLQNTSLSGSCWCSSQ